MALICEVFDCRALPSQLSVIRRPKVIDAFTFFNEEEMLKIRMLEIGEDVDFVIVVEGTQTFSGREKEMFFDKTILPPSIRLKLVHVVVDLVPDTVKVRNDAWARESFQRNSILKGVHQLLNDGLITNDDIVIVSDVDEIPRRETIDKIRASPPVGVVALHMNMHYFDIFTRAPNQEPWNKPRVVSVRNLLKTTPQEVRMKRPDGAIKESGWHLTYFFDSKGIEYKLKSFSHVELNNENVIKDIDKNIQMGKHLVEDTRFVRVDEVPIDAPKYFREYRDRP